MIPFGIKVMPFDEQKHLIDSIRAEIDPPGTDHDPPAGCDAPRGRPAGACRRRELRPLVESLPAGARWPHRGRARAARRLPLGAPRAGAAVPIVLATGWAALGLAIAGVPLNPMSATLGALVIAIATEFSVLLAARYEEERRPGLSRRRGAAPRLLADRRWRSLASGITAIAGFAALVATDIRMLRDFGLVTVVDLAVALLGVLIVLPAALVWAEDGSRTPPTAPPPSPPLAAGPAGSARC